MAINLIICGAAGRMGGSIIRLAKENAVFSVAGMVEAGPALAAGMSPDIGAVIDKGEVVIDFTAPAAMPGHLAAAVRHGKAIVIGTTGIDEKGRAAIAEAARKIPVVFSPNFSIGVNLLFRLAAEAARIVPDYDIEIVELHHNQKKDAPSGTAVKLAQVMAGALGRDLDKVGVYGREGIVGPRRKEEIGVLAVRGGDIVGDHTVYLVGQGERIELTHRAHTRDNLAAGALRAAQWIAGKKPGLYDMQDVMGLK